MKKFFKIFGITLGGIVGLLLVAVCIVLWLVFTPERVTKIVNNNVDKFLLAEVRLDKAELTFFSSFPKFQIKIENIEVVNPVGLENDTVAKINILRADIDIKELLGNHNVVVSKVDLYKPNLFLYVDLNICNFDIMKNSEEEDTSSSSFIINDIADSAISLEEANIV
jgi:uncharacterized protein involved in outer membrane biogenesis